MVHEIQTSPALAQLDGILIEHAIMHHLDPEGKGLGERLVAAEIDFSDKTGPVVRRRLEQFLLRSYDESDTFAIADEEAKHSHLPPTLEICWQTLHDSGTFVEVSRSLAERLATAMRARPNISEGDMLLAIAHDAVGPMLAILKLEKWEELVSDYVLQEDGTYKVKLIPNENIVHTRTVPQKCAFIRPPDYNDSPYIRLHDNQTRDRETAARFFLHAFLGCKLVTTTAKRTIDFCVAAESWRQQNADYLPRQGLVSFTKALITYLPKTELQFEDFARAALEGANNDTLSVVSLVNLLTSTVYPGPTRRGAPDLLDPPPMSFKPDPETVENLMKEVDLALSNNIRLVGPSKDMLPVLDAIASDKEEGSKKLLLPLHTTQVARRFPGVGVVKSRTNEDFQDKHVR